MSNELSTKIVDGKTSFYHPKCLLYDPLSSIEGTCAYDKATVNFNGCNAPKGCDRYIKFLDTKK